MPAHPTTVSRRSDAAEAPTTRSDCRKRSGPEKRYGRSLLPFLAASAGPTPRAIAGVWEPSGVFTRRLPPHHWH